MGCILLCTFYALGLFSGLVLEMLHEVSHFAAPGTHQHSFLTDHEAVDYSSLEAMAGHSHEALEALKELLEADQQDGHESKDVISLKLDKHFIEKNQIAFENKTVTDNNRHWIYQNPTSFWCQGVSTPPPQNT